MTPTISSKNRLVFVGILASLVIIPVFSFLLFGNGNSFGDEIAISNYNDYVKNLPKERRDAINNALYGLVKLNLIDGEKMIKSIAVIRKGSTSESYNKSTDVTSGSFIVDLKDIRESYKATYDWSDNPDNPNVSGYVTTLTCLSDKKDMIYEDFGCKDGSENTGVPLQYQLPHADIAGPFKIIYAGEDGSAIEIAITNSTPNGRQKALEWLRSRGFNPTNIIISYSELHNRLVRFNNDFE